MCALERLVVNRAGLGSGGMLGHDRYTDACSLFLGVTGQNQPRHLSTPRGITHCCPRVLHILPASPCLRHVPSLTYRQRGQESIGGISPHDVPRVCVRVRQGAATSLWALFQHIAVPTYAVPHTQGEGKPPEVRVRFLSLEFAALFLLQVAAGERKTRPPR